jgi:hypothetical protein
MMRQHQTPTQSTLAQSSLLLPLLTIIIVLNIFRGGQRGQEKEGNH